MALRMTLPALFPVLLALAGIPPATAQQLADPDFHPEIPSPAYSIDQGPVVAIDEAHFNFHTVDGRYAPLAEVLRRDGFRVRGLDEAFTRESLAGIAILVIANALPDTAQRAEMFRSASAVTADEIEALLAWVRDGGGLMLIADHHPFPGAVDALAQRLGVLMTNGYAFDRAEQNTTFRFTLADGTLGRHAILDGFGGQAPVDSVVSFTGQAFRPAPGADVTPLLALPRDRVVALPTELGVFDESTPWVHADGMLQGACLTVGAGRVAVFGEAAMFTAQVAGEERRKVGMNHPDARGNLSLALNVMRWLGGAIE